MLEAAPSLTLITGGESVFRSLPFAVLAIMMLYGNKFSMQFLKSVILDSLVLTEGISDRIQVDI